MKLPPFIGPKMVLKMGVLFIMEKEEKKSMSPLAIIAMGIVSGVIGCLSVRATDYVAGKVKSALDRRATTDAKDK